MAPHRMATPDSHDDEPVLTYTSHFQSTQRPLVPGMYAPTPCFFDNNEEVDPSAISRHAIRLARAGLAGITTQGSNGEAVHLSPAERQQVTRTTRNALDAAGFLHVPIIVGCGAQSTRESIALCNEAAEAGGDYVLILPPSYYKAGLGYPRVTLMTHFRTIAEASPLPVLIYNYPGAASGLDLDSDFLLELAAHPNVVGVKLTCGNLGKMGRVISGASDRNLPFFSLAGSADFLIPSLSIGAAGGLVGLANLLPKTCVALQRAYEQGDHKRARYLQGVLARADEIVQKSGVVGTKAILQEWYGYGGFARRPLPRFGEGVSQDEWRGWIEGMREGMQEEARC
jgi:4-hydroxy-2-oxoglutarate aldolase